MSAMNSTLNDDSQPLATTETSHVPLPTTPNVKRLRQAIALEKYRIIADKLLEIEQINSEEILVYGEINRLNYKRQYLQNLLSLVHLMNTTRRVTRTRRLQRN